jgi:hypothetical protein
MMWATTEFDFHTKFFRLGTYHVETNTLIQAMQTAIITIASRWIARGVGAFYEELPASPCSFCRTPLVALREPPLSCLSHRSRFLLVDPAAANVVWTALRRLVVLKAAAAAKESGAQKKSVPVPAAAKESGPGATKDSTSTASFSERMREQGWCDESFLFFMRWCLLFYVTLGME